MIEIVSDGNPAEQEMFAQWAIRRLKDDSVNTPADLGPYYAVGIKRNGKAAAVVVWNMYHMHKYGADIRVIIASDDPRWCLPGVLRELFSYPFNQAGCTRITAIIKDGNERSLKLCRGLGFRKEGVLRRGYNGRTNAVLLSMLKEECTWLQPPEERLHGRKKRTVAASGSGPREDDRSSKRRGSRRAAVQQLPKRRNYRRADRSDGLQAASGRDS